MRSRSLLRWVLCILLAGHVVQAANSSPSMKAPVEGIIELTASNFDSHVFDGHVWLVEFCTPWCSYCASFESTYKEIAEHFHAIPDGKIKVGRVDAVSEDALATRFGADSFPSFYVVQGLSVYEFIATRSKENLMEFVEEAYKKTSPIYLRRRF